MIELLEVLLFIKIVCAVRVSHITSCGDVPRAQEGRNNSAVRCDKVRIMSTSEMPDISA